MEVLFALVILVPLVIVGIIIALFIGQSTLKDRLTGMSGRLETLEREVRNLRQMTLATPSPPAAQPAVMTSDIVVSDAALTADILPDAPPDVDMPVVTAPPVAATPNQNQPLVMRPDRFAALADWLKHNWVYAVSALSLALAGVFFVQYGMEKGLLPPAVRVLSAIVFGAGLIGAGEWLRRRHGDGAFDVTAYLPSVFSGAGLVSIFAAVLAARQLYGLIGPEVAFAAHLVTAALAVGLGWIYGPLLVAVGLLGAALSPFIVAGDSDAGPWLYA